MIRLYAGFSLSDEWPIAAVQFPVCTASRLMIARYPTQTSIEYENVGELMLLANEPTVNCLVSEISFLLRNGEFECRWFWIIHQ